MLKDKRKGDEAELELIEFLNRNGVDFAKKNEDYEKRYLYDVTYDLTFSSHGTAKRIGFLLTFEVKNDIMAKRTGNVAIEHHNCKQDKPSGVMATEAHFWCHKLGDTIWVVPVNKLKKYMAEVEPLKKIVAGGDKNANLYIYKIDDFTSICKPLTEFNHAHDFLDLLSAWL